MGVVLVLCGGVGGEGLNLATERVANCLVGIFCRRLSLPFIFLVGFGRNVDLLGVLWVGVWFLFAWVAVLLCVLDMGKRVLGLGDSCVFGHIGWSVVLWQGARFRFTIIGDFSCICSSIMDEFKLEWGSALLFSDVMTKSYRVGYLSHQMGLVYRQSVNFLLGL